MVQVIDIAKHRLPKKAREASPLTTDSRKLSPEAYGYRLADRRSGSRSVIERYGYFGFEGK